MRERQGVIAIPEGRNIRTASEMSNKKTLLWKHCTLEHGGEKVDFTITALGSFRSCLKRQVNEAVRISSSQADILLNSKSEFHQAPLTRLVAFMGLHGDQGEDQAGQAFPGDGGAGAVGRARAGRRNEGE